MCKPKKFLKNADKMKLNGKFNKKTCTETPGMGLSRVFQVKTNRNPVNFHSVTP